MRNGWKNIVGEYRAWTPFRRRLLRLLRQIKGVNPFDGDCLPTRVRLIGFGRPSLPFPHLWNYREPIRLCCKNRLKIRRVSLSPRFRRQS